MADMLEDTSGEPAPLTLWETPDFVVRRVPPGVRNSSVAGMTTCWVTRWKPDAAVAIKLHRVNAVSIPHDGAEATGMLRDLSRFADQITYLRLRGPKTPFDLSPVNELANLRHIEASLRLDTLDLSRLPRLTSLWLTDMTRYDGIAKAPALEELWISFSKGLRDLTPFAGSPLKKLKLHAVNTLRSLAGAEDLPHLSDVELDVNRGLKSVRALADSNALRRFSLYGSRGIEDLDQIGLQPAMETFAVNNGPTLPSFEMLGGMRPLREFFLNSTNIGPAARLVAPLFTLPELRKATFRAGPNLGFAQIEDIESLAQATKLEKLYLDRMPELESLDFLAGMTALRKIYIIRTNVRRKNLEILKTLPLLSDVQFPDGLEYRYRGRKSK